MSHPTPTATSVHHGWPDDHTIWLMCFTTAISGHLAGREKTLKELPPKTIAARCAKIADAALEEVQKRRPESK